MQDLRSLLSVVRQYQGGKTPHKQEIWRGGLSEGFVAWFTIQTPHSMNTLPCTKSYFPPSDSLLYHTKAADHQTHITPHTVLRTLIYFFAWVFTPYLKIFHLNSIQLKELHTEKLLVTECAFCLSAIFTCIHFLSWWFKNYRTMYIFQHFSKHEKKQKFGKSTFIIHFTYQIHLHYPVLKPLWTKNHGTNVVYPMSLNYMAYSAINLTLQNDF